MFLRIDHVAILVPNLEEAIRAYENNFNVSISSRSRNEEGGFEIASFAVGDSHIELLSPFRPDSVLSGVLIKRGPGIHHIAVEVDDIYQSITDIKVKGLALTNEEPKRGSGDSLITFIHPKSLFGSMLELVELSKK